ncbi:sensor histidine kinase [Streptomyces sp. NRRL F-2580]|uniref:sensor histidine kinase n=1 Tax=Streptomyces sp. NRRL F-2580 TaxID=1463841 RepID=UPI0006922FBC|nr:HAMP domain-containing sensor histidine kinase [Streptomyces sp. NRRL F-2580]
MSGLRAARHAPSRHAVTGPGRQIRPQLVRAAVLPTLAAGLSGAAAVIFTLQLGGGAGDRDARLWPVLTGCALLVVGALAAALLGAQRGAKAVRDRCEALRRSSVRGRQELRTAADLLERGETPPRPVRGGPTGPLVGGDPAGVDEFWLLSQELRGAREQAHATLVRLAGPATPSDSERTVEVFVNLARRLQSLVHREIALLDELEDTVEDPDLLKELFHVDHLATRIRRHAENLAVLGGAASRRQWTRPIDLSEVLRSSVAEVEQYTRVKVVPPAGGSVRGHAVADVVHLLAELVENATVFSAPDTDVVLRAERVTAGIAVEVEDRGLGMPVEEQHRMNALLGDPDQISVRHLLADGRIGLFVVSALARRHGIAVELKSNIYGGVLAVLVLPQELLGAEAPSAADAAGGSRPTSWGTGEPRSAPRLERVPAPQPWPATPQRAPAAPDIAPGPPPLAVPAPRSGPPTRAVPPPRDPEPDAAAPPRPKPAPAPEAWSEPAPDAGDPAPAGADPWPEAAPLPARGTGDPASATAVTGPGAKAWAEPASMPAPGAGDQASSEAVPDPGAEPWPEAARGAGDPASAGAEAASMPAPEAGSWPRAVPGDGHSAWPEAVAATGTAGSAEDWAAPAPFPTRGAWDPVSAGAGTGAEPVPETGHWSVARDEPTAWSEAADGSAGDGAGASAPAAPARLPVRGAGDPASATAVTGPGSPASAGPGTGAVPPLASAPTSAAAESWAGASAMAVPAPGAEDPASSTAVTGSVAEPWADTPGGLRPGLVPWGGAGPGDADAASAEPWARSGPGAPAAAPPPPRDGAAPGGVDSASAEPWGGPVAPAPSGPDDGTGAGASAMAEDPASAGAVTGPGAEAPDGPVPRDGAAPGAGGETWAGGAVRARGGPRGGEAAGLLPLQRGGEPEVGEERPALPRRRAQQHLAPQLREAPVPRPPADAEQPLHDPGLMAAFQRGFGLAQSENQL